MRHGVPLLICLPIKPVAPRPNPCDSNRARRTALLKSIYSGVHQLSDFKKRGANGIVLVFIGIECPVSAQYLPGLEHPEQFASKQVSCWGLF